MELLEQFEIKLKELNDNGFIFNDLPCFNKLATDYPNMILTKEGIRLIDAGEAIIRSDVGDEIFDSKKNNDQMCFNHVQNIILEYKIKGDMLT